MAKAKNYLLFMLNQKNGELELLGVFTCLHNVIKKVKDDYILIQDIEDGLTDIVVYSQLQNELFDSHVAELEFTTKEPNHKQKLFD